MVWVQSIIKIPTICGKIGKDIELLNGSIYQCSILFNNLRSFNRKSEFRKPGNLNKPITKSEKINIAELSLLSEFLGNSYAHVILTSEADSLPTDTWQLLEDYGLVGCHSARSHGLFSPCKNRFHRLCSPSFGINRKSNWVFLCVDFWGKMWSETRKSTRRFARENSWYASLWPWNCCISHWRQRPQHHWGHSCAYCKMYLGHQGEVTCDPIKSSETAVLCVPSPSWASNEGTLSCSTIFAKVKKVQHYRVDVIVGDAIAAAYMYYKRQEYKDLYNSSVAVMLREKCNARSTWTAHFRADVILIIRSIITILSFAPQIIFFAD